VGLALTTDLYELTMAASYLGRGMTEAATFSLFVRDLPPDRGFLVAAGLHDLLRVLEDFAFDDDDLGWLAQHGFDRAALDAFASLRFTGEVWAIPEGHVVLPNEPLVEVTAPLPEAQLVESILLNQITFQTVLATKAARCRVAARGRAPHTATAECLANSRARCEYLQYRNRAQWNRSGAV
jgi:nicotinate phosphoribosyltransferase